MYKEDFSITHNQHGRVEMSDLEFRKLSKFIHDDYGIKLPESKKVMIQARLQKRLRATSLPSYSAYLEHVFSEGAKHGEMIHMIDEITTNKTDFFREPIHFEFLNHVVLPGIVENHRQGKVVNIWSAGCSTGEEPYTIAISISEFSRLVRPLDYRILGTDLSTEVLKTASQAIYNPQRQDGIPSLLRKRYFRDNPRFSRGELEIIPEFRSRVFFKRLNFMDNYYDVQGQFDVVFCRNVMIYFEKSVQEQVINKICRHIPTGGFLFLGHSESILGMNVPLKQVKPTIYTKI